MPEENTVDLSQTLELIKAFRRSPIHIIQRYPILPVRITKDTIVIAIFPDCENIKFAIDEIGMETSKKVECVYASREDILTIIRLISGINH